MDILIGIGIIILVLLIIRAFGAWMLRIDEVIDVQKEILEELKKSNSSRSNSED
jgi:hypothetical protein